MGLFKRKSPIVDEGPRCPECRERLPDGAAACAMCGRDLQDPVAPDDRRVAMADGSGRP